MAGKAEYSRDDPCGHHADGGFLIDKSPLRRSIVVMTLAVIMLATLHTLLMLAQASGAVQRSDD